MTKKHFLHILFLVLLVLSSNSEISAQERDKNMSVGIHYAYAGVSNVPGVASGIGINGTLPVSGRFEIGVSSSFYFPVCHQVRDIAMSVEYQKKLVASSISGRVKLARAGIFDVYGTAGILYNRYKVKGSSIVSNDVGPAETTTYKINANKYEFGPQFGTSLEVRQKVNFFIEPSFLFTNGAVFLISGGVRLPL